MCWLGTLGRYGLLGYREWHKGTVRSSKPQLPLRTHPLRWSGEPFPVARRGQLSPLSSSSSFSLPLFLCMLPVLFHSPISSYSLLLQFFARRWLFHGLAFAYHFVVALRTVLLYLIYVGV